LARSELLQDQGGAYPLLRLPRRTNSFRCSYDARGAAGADQFENSKRFPNRGGIMTTATIIPFPLANRRSMILRQARYAAVLNPDAAERHIQRQLKIQDQAMRRRGIDERLITREINCLETSIRATLLRDIAGGIR
jgi:Family of unknown function (DUF6074)